MSSGCQVRVHSVLKQQQTRASVEAELETERDEKTHAQERLGQLNNKLQDLRYSPCPSYHTSVPLTTLPLATLPVPLTTLSVPLTTPPVPLTMPPVPLTTPPVPLRTPLVPLPPETWVTMISIAVTSCRHRW